MTGPSYYDRVAAMYNSSIVLRTIPFSTEFGDPFHEVVVLQQPSKEFFVTGESVKQSMQKFKGAFIDIEGNVKLSGNGEGSFLGNDVRSFVTEYRGKKRVVANQSTSKSTQRNKDQLKYLVSLLYESK